jgi:hypothetical protein
LPWLCLLAISTTAAYAFTGALVAGDAVTNETATPLPQLSQATQALADGDDVRARFLSGEIADQARRVCDTTGGRLLYVGANTWVPVDAAASPCPDAR